MQATAGDVLRVDALANRVVLVIGGDRGIGAPVALAGADVAIAFHEHDDDAKRWVEAIQELGRYARAFRYDVADRDQARGLVAAVEDEFTRVDGLVNNAGIMQQSPDEDLR